MLINVSHIVSATKILKRKKSLRAGLEVLRNAIWFLEDTWIWWAQWEGKRSSSWEKQTQGGRKIMVHKCKQRALGMWNIREFRADFYWSESKFEKKLWSLICLWVGHLALEARGLYAEAMTLILRDDTDRNPQKGTRNVSQINFALVWKEARWSEELLFL